jgi:hypothetical protein
VSTWAFGAAARPIQALSAVNSVLMRIPATRSATQAAVGRFVKGSTGGPDADARAKSGSYVVAVAYDLTGSELSQVVINPLDKLAFTLRIPPPGDALLEMTGRCTGRPRVTSVCDGTEGDTFWIVAQHGHSADYVRNLQANPSVLSR